MKQSLFLIWLIVLCTLFVAAIILVVIYLDLQQPIIVFFEWLQNNNRWSALIFISIDMLLVIFLIPSIIFTLGAGFLFGTFLGTVCVVLATTLGGAIAFISARHLFNQQTKNYLRNHQKLKVVNDELVNEGWKIILLTRLMPFFPLKLSNYFFGASNFSITDFVVGTALGVIPNTLVIVYMGSLAADLTMLASGEVLLSKQTWWYYLTALVLLLFTVGYITRHAQKALRRYQNQSVKQTGGKHAA